MRSGARRVGALSALTVVSIVTALASGMASTAVAANNSVTQVKEVHSLAQSHKRQAGPDLSVTKTGPTSATEGDQVSYTITVKNVGAATSGNWTVTDYIPAGLTNVSYPGNCTLTGTGLLTCTGAGLAPTDPPVQITVTGTAGRGFTSIQNIVTVSSAGDVNDSNNAAATTPTSITPRRADLEVRESGPSTVAQGDPVAYTITVRNLGPNDATGWTVTDQLPAALTAPITTSSSSMTTLCSVSSSKLLTCSDTHLTSGQSTVITVHGVAGPNFTGVQNTATVSSSDDPNGTNDSGSTQVGTPGLRITKSVQAPRRISPGDTVRYTVRVRNTGQVDYLSGNLARFTDDLSGLLDDARFNDDADATVGLVSYDEPKLTWTGVLRRGETAVITYSVTVHRRDLGDLRLGNGLVSDTPGSNCAASHPALECSTLGTVDDRGRDPGRALHGAATDRAGVAEHA